MAMKPCYNFGQVTDKSKTPLIISLIRLILD